MPNRSYATANSILAAARECKLDRAAFRQVPGGRAEQLLDKVIEHFTKGGLRNRGIRWLWNNLREPHFSLSGPHELDALLALGPPETPVWLIVEDWDGTKHGAPFWIFEATLTAAVATLKNHHLLEFYLVSRSFNWLVGENHHDVLFAVGDDAVKMLRDLAG